MMDNVDPLGDLPPPRYAVESDEEDEFNPLIPKPGSLSDKPIDINIAGEVPTGRSLLVASGDGAAFWAKGANLGEQVGAVYVNDVQVALVFRPTWTNAVILVSEAFTRLPIVMYHPYAARIISSFAPSVVALLDTYPTPTYISSEPLSKEQSPIRYLSTATPDTYTVESAQPFAPPNLLKSSSAAFIAILNLPGSNVIAKLLLLPSSRTALPPPGSLQSTNINLPSENWSTEAMNRIHGLICHMIGGEKSVRWEIKEGSANDATMLRKSKHQVAEGSLYI